MADLTPFSAMGGGGVGGCMEERDGCILQEFLTRSQIHERRFLSIILRLQYSDSGFCLQCLHYKPFQTTFALGVGGGGGVKSVSRGDCEWQGGKLRRLLSQLRPKMRPQSMIEKKESDIKRLRRVGNC